jgi:large exoprotein involved in heme utilization and adhesion
VSSATYLGFGDKFIFSALSPLAPFDPNNPPALTSTPPAAFGFAQPTPAPISVLGSTLQVLPGNTLSVTGGDAQIVSGQLNAPGGRIAIASVGSPGEVAFNAATQIPEMNPARFTRLGEIDISRQAGLDARPTDPGGRGGTVLIRGGRLVMDASTLSADTGNVDGARLGIDVQVAQGVTLANDTLLQTSTSGIGRAGDIALSVGSLAITGGAQIMSLTFSRGRGGDITVTAASSVGVSGRTPANNPSAIVTQTLGRGPGGRVSISAPSLTMEDTGSVNTNSFSAAALGGDIVVDVGRLSLTGGARIRSTAAGGPGGNVRVQATDSATFSGASSGILMSGFGTAHVGDIFVNAGTLTLTGGAQIQSGSVFNRSQGGGITLAASRQIVISDGGGLSSQSFNLDAGRVVVAAPSLTMDRGFINTSTLGKGRAGDISLNVGTLTLTDGAQIASSSQKFSTGPGGNVTATATDSVSISGRSGTGVGSSPFSNDASSGLFSTAAGTGPAGQITVSAPALAITDGGKISVATAGAVTAAAGDISVNVGTLTLASGARIDSGTTGAGRGGNVAVIAPGSVSVSGSGVSSNATASGTGGNVTINTAQMELTDHATLSATSSGSGKAGSIALTLGESLRLQNSAITTAARLADGGNISITTTGSILYLLNGKITTSVQSGFGEGGNITIGSAAHPIGFVILNGSEIRADAFGGPGGNINIFAGTYLTSNSVVSASSALGLPGTIGIQAGITDISGTVGQLPESVLQAATLLRAACATRLAGGQSSSLVVSGREGLPAEPGGVLPSPLVAEGPADSTGSLDEQPGGGESSNRIALWIPAPRCLR